MLCQGAILGARVGDERLPEVLKAGLYDRDLLEKEIDSFVDAVMQKTKKGAKATAKEL